MSDRDRPGNGLPPAPPNWLATTGYARNARAREDRPASGAQLYRLNMLGLLALRNLGADPILGATAYRLLAQLKAEGRW